MAELSMKEKLEKFGIKKAIGYLTKNPEKNLPKLMDMVDKIDKDNSFLGARHAFHAALDDPESNWYQLIMRVLHTVDNKMIQSFFSSFIMGATLVGGKKQSEIREKYGCNVPWAILLDPTSGCNLHCTGCWAASYGHKLNLTYEEIDDIINQGTAMGTYMYIYTGGEPLVRKDDIIKICENHPNCVFLCFTNGTLIDDKFAEDLLRVGNFFPAISVEGDEESTDARRGKGVFQKVCNAMRILREHKLPFGVSCCYTSQNIDKVGTEAFYDWMIEQGAIFCWFFTYMPVDADAPLELMVRPEQREYMYHFVRGMRDKKALFTLDFFLDGEYVYGCIAGGRYYLHINANGDIDPCVFIHYSDSNIREKTLLEAYRSPLFMEYHKNQPFNENMLRPCPLLDNPYRLEKVVKDSGAHCSDPVKPQDVHDLCAKCEKQALAWKPVADKLWAESAVNGKHCLNDDDTILPENRVDPSKVMSMEEAIAHDDAVAAEKKAAKEAAKKKEA